MKNSFKKENHYSSIAEKASKMLKEGVGIAEIISSTYRKFDKLDVINYRKK